MAIETADTARRQLGAAVLGLIELLLGKWGEEQAQSFELLGVEDAIEQLVIIHDRHQLSLRDVAQVGAGGEEDRRRKLGKELIRDVEVKVEAGQIAPFLPLDLVDVELRKNHAAFRMIRVWKRLEPLRESVPLPNLVGAH